MNSEERIFLNPTYFRKRGTNIPRPEETPPFTDIPANSRIYGLIDRLCEEQGIPSPSELPRMIQEQHAEAIAVGQAFPKLAQFDAQLTQFEENENLLNPLLEWQDKIGKRLQQKQGRIQRKQLLNRLMCNPYFVGAIAFTAAVAIAYMAGSAASHQQKTSTSSPTTELRDGSPAQ
jgi:hypothetical protein